MVFEIVPNKKETSTFSDYNIDNIILFHYNYRLRGALNNFRIVPEEN